MRKNAFSALISEVIFTVLLINGSPNKSGTTKEVLKIIGARLGTHGIECDMLDAPCGIFCTGCRGCKDGGGCVKYAALRDISNAFKNSDGIIIVSPVYFASPPGSLIGFLDALFMSSKFDKRRKVGASFTVSRRAGATGSYDIINKYFGISGMPIASSNYWNLLRAKTPEEVEFDIEGVRCAETLADNFAYLISAIKKSSSA